MAASCRNCSTSETFLFSFSAAENLQLSIDVISKLSRSGASLSGIGSAAFSQCLSEVWWCGLLVLLPFHTVLNRIGLWPKSTISSY